MSYYTGNQSSIPTTDVGTFTSLPSYYWWEAGAAWGGLIDYWAYTNDTTYNPTVTQALLAQVGPDNNYMPPAQDTNLVCQGTFYRLRKGDEECHRNDKADERTGQ